MGARVEVTMRNDERCNNIFLHFWYLVGDAWEEFGEETEGEGCLIDVIWVWQTLFFFSVHTCNSISVLFYFIK